MIEIKQTHDKTAWDNLVKLHNGHPLQLWGWGEVKSRHGWIVDRVVLHDDSESVGGASLLIKKLPQPFNQMVYVARGPWGKWNDVSREKLETYVKRTYQPVSMMVEPDQTDAFTWKGWKHSPNRILLARTATMDLRRSLDDLQSDMSKKTRQYIRKSAGEGIAVRLAKSHDDIRKCLEIYKATAKRANFALHEDQYYLDIFDRLADDSPVYIAEHKGRVVVFLWPIVTPEIAFELYGGMNEEGQSLRANYHLKWHVIQAMKQQGVRRYDVNGLLNDGVTTFKKGFIPDETQMVGTYEKGMSSWYPVWRYALPIAKRVAQSTRRRVGK